MNLELAKMQKREKKVVAQGRNKKKLFMTSEVKDKI